MDLRLTAMIALAHVRLRQEVLFHYPHLIDERIAMARFKLPMPIELAGLASRMTRAQDQEREIGALGERYDRVQGDIDDAIEAHNEHVDDLEHYRDAWMKKVDSMLARPNGGDPLQGGAKTGQSGQSGAGQEKTALAGQSSDNGEKVVVTAAEVGSVETVIGTAPEQLTVNGVSIPKS